MTTAARTLEPSTITTDDFGAIERELLDGVTGGCAACGTPGQPCATPQQGMGQADAAGLLAAAFARR